MTDEERALVLALAKVWDSFLSLPVEHDDDTQEFRQGIHAVQRMILARSGRREINGYRHL
jgi:hypothetical protein